MVSSTIQGGGGSVRGVRDQFNAGTVLGVLPGKGKGVPIGRLTIQQIASAIANNGALPLPGTITSATLDAVFGSTEGSILQRGPSVWQVLLPGTSGQVLTSQGAAALNHWAAGGGGGSTISNAGAWAGGAGYSVGQVVQWLSSAYLCYATVAAAAGSAQHWDSTNFSGTVPSLSTTNTTNDTATNSSGGDNAIGGNQADTVATKLYFEVVFTANSDNNTAIGIANFGRTINFIRGQAIGNINGYGTGVGSGSWPGITVNKRIGVCWDKGGDGFYICPDVTAGSQNWNGSTSNNPSTSTGPVSAGSDATAHAQFPFVEFQSNSADACVLYTTVASVIGIVPTGYTVWSQSLVANISPDLDIAHWLSQGNQNPANLNEHALLGGI